MQFQGFSYYAPLSTTVVYGGGDGTRLGHPEKRHAERRRRGDRHSGPHDRPPAKQRRRSFARRIPDSRRGRPHARHGFLGRHYEDHLLHARRTADDHVFGDAAARRSANWPRPILRNPAEVNIAISKPNEAIDQSAYICYERQKLGIIRELFAEPTDSKTIIFSSSKLKVKELAHTLKRMGLDVAAMHSDLEQAQREEVMLNFKNNKVKILVATDIVARGIDIEDIGLVLNYDVPHDPEDYIHRIGRTARAAASGRRHDVRQRGGAGQVPPVSRNSSSGTSARPNCPRAWAKARNTLPTRTAAASAGGAGVAAGEGVPARAADAADAATVRVVTTGTAAANARRLRLRLRLRNLPRHNPLRRTATTLRAVAKATAGPATAAVTAEAAIGAAATSRRAANRRRRHKYQKFPSNQRREFLFTSVLPGVITYSNVPPSGAYAISLPEGGLGWGRIYLLSHAGCAGSSAVRASARLMPSARATPSPYDGSAL